MKLNKHINVNDLSSLIRLKGNIKTHINTIGQNFRS